ncbi:PQQ-binding-like beta-propeller repeat protein [Pontiellaceae bacterium B12227]|nr:PQQ-binding-like beta-propeller repeat protein [Pontiellaceae bacterium B12227]
MKKQILCGVVALIAAGAVADDWYTWRGPNANGISGETGLNPKGASKLWTKELGVGYSSVSVKDGRLYTMGNIDDKDIVYCLDAKNGDEIWRATYACKPGKFKGPRATPVVDGKNLYTVSREGELFCYELDSGKKKWSTDVLDKTNVNNLRWGTSTSAVIEGNLVLLNIGTSGAAVDKHTGKIKWKSSGQHSYASPVVFKRKGKTCAAIFSAAGLQVVDVTSGKKVAAYDWKTKYDINGADPMIIGDRIFISSGYDRESAMLDFSSGKLKKIWSSDIMKNQFSSSIHVDGFIYGVDGQTKKKGFLRCIDAKDGAEKWSMPIGFGSLIAADGKLIALGEKGALHFLEITPDKCNELATFTTGLSQLCWTPPALANGIVYCRNDKGTLVAVEVR